MSFAATRESQRPRTDARDRGDMLTAVDQLRGIAISGYRSFVDGSLQPLGPMSKVNLVAGQNNAGKSNVLRLVSSLMNAGGGTDRAKPSALGPLDAPSARTAQGEPLRFALAIDLDHVATDVTEIMESTHRGEPPMVRKLVEYLSGEPFRLEGSELTWLRYRMSEGSWVATLDDAWVAELAADPAFPAELVSNVGRALTGNSGGSNADSLLRMLRPLEPSKRLPPATVIESHRKVDIQNANPRQGSGLIRQLAQLESPAATDASDSVKFAAIQQFVRTVLEDDDVVLTIPFERDTINLRWPGSLLPIEHMGTGVQQVIILAAAATLLSGHLVCIEEPEVHLHPILQRKLLRYLAENTDNQYLIATHSAHLLDADLAAIFHVTLTEHGSTIHSAQLPRERAAICADLGYRASDLVQANAIIWVEGPSDRTYLQRWLELAAPDLIEHVHYSIMFYGGRLLSHLSANDPDVDDFISLRRLNRQVAIVIDSDRTAKGQRISATKRRVAGELADGTGIAWITAGYTIENYVPTDLLAAAVVSTHSAAHVSAAGQYDNPLGPKLVKGVASPDKTRIARNVALKWGEDTPWPFDLRKRVAELVRFVHEANGTTAVR